MRYSLGVFLVLVSSLSVLGQASNKLRHPLLTKVQHLLDCYEQLYPFNEYTVLEKLSLDTTTLQELEVYLTEESITYEQRDSVETFYLIGYFQYEIMELMQKIVLDKDRMQLLKPLEEAYESSGVLNIAYAPDHKLFNITLDEKTGGTYRSRLSIVYFTEFENVMVSSSEENYNVFHRDGVGWIDTVESEEGTKYILVGYLQGCTTCFESNIRLIHFVDGAFEVDFNYSVVSRDYDTGVYYDAKKKEIEIDYVTDDLTPLCDCVDAAVFIEEAEIEEETEEEVIPIRCKCSFVFNGRNFKIVKASWEALEK